MVTTANSFTPVTVAAELNPSLASQVLANLTVADQAAMLGRLSSLLPASWFGTGLTEVNDVIGSPAIPVLTTVLSGPAYNLAWIYVLYQYVLKQSRIATATGVWLDRISYDFFGTNLPRRSGETDNLFRVRIINEILRPRSTRVAIALALFNLTGVSGQVTELWNPFDCGGYDQGVMGYDFAGMYGDLALNNQFFVVAFRPFGSGIANIEGYDNPIGAYDFGSFEYIDMSSITGPILDSEIYATIASTLAAGTTAWTIIESVDNVSGAAGEPLFFGAIADSGYFPALPFSF